MNELCLCEEVYRTRYQNETEPIDYVEDYDYDYFETMTIPLTKGTILMMTFYITIMVIGIPLNIIVLCVAAAFRRTQPCSTFLLVNMAIQDLLILFTTPVGCEIFCLVGFIRSLFTL